MAISTAGQRGELQLVQALLSSLGSAPSGAPGGWVAPADIGSVAVLDCGGGTGRMAVPIAQLGARVTVIDISADALASLARRAAEAGVADRVTAVQGDLEMLADAVGGEVFDLALVHGVLDAVEPHAALAGVHAALRPGGWASVLITNPAAGVIAKVLSGELEAAVADLRAGTAGGHLDAAALADICQQVGLAVDQVTGVGVFADLIPLGSSSGVTAAGNSVAAVAAELESLGRGVSPYREMASRLHILAQRAPA